MATQPTAAPAAEPAANSNEPVFSIQRVYLKDFSLEQPNAPKILLKQGQPAIEIQLNVNANEVDQGFYEVVVTANVHAKLESETLFLVEGHQAGIFEIRNLPEDQRAAIMGITCPHILYPYLRAQLADGIQKAGFPPIHLEEINFQVMYEEAKAAEAAAQSAPKA